MKTVLFAIVSFIFLICCSKEDSEKFIPTENNDTLTPNEEILTLEIPKGIISTGSKEIPIPQKIIDNPNVDGYMVMGAWKNIQPLANSYDWSFIDSEVNRAVESNKKVRIAIHTGGSDLPEWVIQDYPTIKKILLYDIQTSQPIYAPAYWDDKFIELKSQFFKAISEHYKDIDNVFGISISMVDPNTGDWFFSIEDEEQKQSFLDAGFSESVFIAAHKKLIDNAMSSVYNKHVTTAVGPLHSSLVTDKYFALNEVLKYSFSKYGDKLIIAKGSLNAQTPNPAKTNNLKSWQVMYDYKPYCAGQFVWAVSNDIDFKMNGGLPYTNKDSILAAAFDIGLLYELNWIELWKADILNPDLQDEIEYARNKLINSSIK